MNLDNVIAESKADDDAFWLGYRAFEDGHDDDANPFAETHPLHKSWQAGYDQAGRDEYPEDGDPIEDDDESAATAQGEGE